MSEGTFSHVTAPTKILLTILSNNLKLMTFKLITISHKTRSWAHLELILSQFKQSGLKQGNLLLHSLNRL